LGWLADGPLALRKALALGIDLWKAVAAGLRLRSKLFGVPGGLRPWLGNSSFLHHIQTMALI